MGHPDIIAEIKHHVEELLEVYEDLKKLDEPDKKSLHWYYSSFPIFATHLKNTNPDPDGNVLESNSNRHALSILLVYLYMRLEHAQRRVLRGAAITEYKINKIKAEYITEKFDMRREQFYTSYNKIAGEGWEFNKETKNIIYLVANDVRDNILHGKYMTLNESKKKNAIISVFEYSKLLSKQVKERFEFEPFGMLDELKTVPEILNEADTIKQLKDVGIKLKDGA